MRHMMNKTGTVLALLLLNVLIAAGYVPYQKSQLRMQKLCSKSLSDALYVICQGSGYNEPFSYSGEDEPRADTGPGLVEECCYHSCTYDQLAQYCKPLPEEKPADPRDVIKESNVANLPYSTSTRDLSSEQSPPLEMDHVGGAIKRKVDDLKRGRHRGKGGRNDDGECRGKSHAKKRHRGRHCRCRRRRLECRRAGKISRGNVKPLVNKFTISPPTETTISFPSTS